MPDGGQGRSVQRPSPGAHPSYHLTLQVGTAGLRQAGWRVQSGEARRWRPGDSEPGLLILTSMRTFSAGLLKMISCL